MKRLANQQQEDAEAQTFYALALLSNASSSDRSRKNQKEAAAVLEPLFRKYPEHPGVAHYLIHAYDNPEMARTGLPAARAYAKIAPAAPHALHMPSHIFTLLGLWEDSIQSNQAARAAAHEQKDTGEELHAMDYLEYAYLQAGQYESAGKLLQELNAMSMLQLGDFKVGYAATAMPVRYAIERRDWSAAGSLAVHDESLPQVSAITHWARAVGLARGGNPGAAEKEMEQLKQCLGKVRAAKDDYWASQVEIQIAEANSWIVEGKGQGTDAITLMRSAADREDQLEKRPITPGAIVPAREQLGELLLLLKQPGEALTEFEAALKNAPERRGALAGASKAAELAGNAAKARQYKAQL
jgi:tetratricopeptide (TPR) repeat protein